MSLTDALEEYLRLTPDGGGVDPLDVLLRKCEESRLSGIAVSHGHSSRSFIIFVNGIPEGAVYSDISGPLYGNKAALLMRGADAFSLHPADSSAMDRVAMSCRVLDKNLIVPTLMADDPSLIIPTRTIQSPGMAVLTIEVRRGGMPDQGIHISIRREGRVLGSGVTTENGIASFRLFFGTYQCVVLDASGVIRHFPVTFHGGDHHETIELDKE
jgi:hypothetical protein